MSKLLLILALATIVSVVSLPVKSSAPQTLSSTSEYAKVIVNSEGHRIAAVGKGETHYEDPFMQDCQAGEVNITIVGVKGAMCAPSCGVLDSCPGDKPAGVSAKPTCALQDMAGRKFCALICAPALPIGNQLEADSQCGPKASCKPISSVGLCTYDE